MLDLHSLQVLSLTTSVTIMCLIGATLRQGKLSPAMVETKALWVEIRAGLVITLMLLSIAQLVLAGCLLRLGH